MPPAEGGGMEISMQVDFYNSRLTEVELSKLRKKALIKTIIGYCDKQYKQTDCFVCDHHTGISLIPSIRKARIFF